MLPGKKHLLFCLIALAATLCAQKAKFVAAGVGTSMKVLKREISDIPSQMAYNTGGVIWGGSWISVGDRVYKGKTDTIFIGIDSGYYKCNTSLTLLLLEKAHCKTTTTLMATDGFNPNKKRYVIGKLKPARFRKNGESFLSIKSVELSIAGKQFRQKYYDSYSDYRKQNPEHEFVSEHEINTAHSVFETDLRLFLSRIGYRDTLNTLNFNFSNQLELSLIVNSMTEHKFDRYCVVELNTTVKLPPVFGLQKEKTYITRSYVGYDNSNQDETNNRELVANALENTIEELLEDPLLKDKFTNPAGSIKNTTGSEEVLTLKNSQQDAVNLESATSAVVTILLNNGHGSGCVIANDGYIVTNYHVAGADTSNLYAIFNSGAKKRCRFVRGNQAYDLALLKVDTLLPNPMKLNLTKTISIGADVYAIGTPGDLSLGQTITRGIISAKRNMEGHIFIQSDASVNKGNSGGALTNKEGELIGIVNSKLIGVGVEGVSFAIPAFYIEEALQVKLTPK